MTAAPTPSLDRRRAERAQARRGVVTAYLFLLPYLILLFMFGVFPVFYALGLSFTDTIDYVFYGVENYAFVFNDFRVPRSIINVLTFVAYWLLFTVIVVLGLSLMLDSLSRRTSGALRTVFFLPGAVTSSAIVVLWLFLLDPGVSPFGPVFSMFAWENRQDVVSGIGFAGVFAIMALFATAGGWIVVFGGALSSLPVEVLEAARVDGARGWSLATRIKLPMIWRSVVLMAVLTFAGGLQMFVEPQLMGMAGAQFSLNDWSMNQLAFEYAFRMGDFGASAALSTMLIGVSIIVALLMIFGTRFYKID